uniref:Bifunctional inhibitor/plant lipid transfer protein/seed storage helical domain-containing protein n=1 Tax=Oryza brachyantha TaxID=4533 RepID=J3LLZ7_ORYBR
MAATTTRSKAIAVALLSIACFALAAGAGDAPRWLQINAARVGASCMECVLSCISGGGLLDVCRSLCDDLCDDPEAFRVLGMILDLPSQMPSLMSDCFIHEGMILDLPSQMPSLQNQFVTTGWVAGLVYRHQPSCRSTVIYRLQDVFNHWQICTV